jgi:hypothetical protein
MSFKPPKGWEKESETLFIHATGVRIQRRVYRDREGWFLIPVDLSQEVVFFEPTPAGRDQAFEAFGKAPARKPKSKKKAIPAGPAAKSKKGRDSDEDPEEESEEDSDEESGEKADEKDSEQGPGKTEDDS